MPAGIICLDCNRIHLPQSGEVTRGRCPTCRTRRAATPRAPHRNTPRRAAGRAFYSSTAWRRLRAHVRTRDGSCRRCGSSDDLTAHHLVSIHDAPERALDAANVVTLCRSCHGKVGNRERAGA